MLLPHAWMDAIHAGLGLGMLPDLRIVSYLTRCLSMFYAVHGLINLYLAATLKRNIHILLLWNRLLLGMGVTVFAIDWFAGMPWFWLWSEGPFVIVFALICERLIQRSGLLPE